MAQEPYTRPDFEYLNFQVDITDHNPTINGNTLVLVGFVVRFPDQRIWYLNDVLVRGSDPQTVHKAIQLHIDSQIAIARLVIETSNSSCPYR